MVRLKRGWISQAKLDVGRSPITKRVGGALEVLVFLSNCLQIIKTKKVTSELGAYLASLIESDGSIIVLKDSTTRPTIKIIFNIKDKHKRSF